MWKYVIRRLLAMVPVLLMVIIIVFSVLNITPGDPATIILGSEAPQSAKDTLNAELGLNDPFPVRLLSYIKNIATLNFGESYRSRNPVFEDIFPKFPTTLKLAILSVAFAALMGIPLGIVSAVRQYSAVDISLTVTSLVLASVPGFWLAMMLILLFSLNLGWLPPSGIGSWKNYVMPVMTLALPSAAQLARITRNQMLEVMRQDYIRTAKAKGAAKRSIITRHALKNTLMPVVTILGLSFAGLLGGAMITEIVFGLPGIGNLIVTAIRMKDIPVVMGSTIFLASMFMLIMLAVDLVYAFINPVIRARFSSR